MYTTVISYLAFAPSTVIPNLPLILYSLQRSIGLMNTVLTECTTTCTLQNGGGVLRYQLSCRFSRCVLIFYSMRLKLKHQAQQSYPSLSLLTKRWSPPSVASQFTPSTLQSAISQRIFGANLLVTRRSYLHTCLRPVLSILQIRQHDDVSSQMSSMLHCVVYLHR